MKIANTAAVLLALGISGSAWAQTSEKGPIAHPQAVADPAPSAATGRASGSDLKAQGNVPTTEQRPAEQIPGTSGPGPNPPSGKTTNPTVGTPSPSGGK